MTLQKIWYGKILPSIEKTFGIFALYGVIPLVCGAMVGLVIFIQSEGSGAATKFLTDLSEQSVAGIIGSRAQKKSMERGFYFLSDEVLPPLHDEAMVTLGGGTYFSPKNSDSANETENSSNKQTPDVI